MKNLFIKYSAELTQAFEIRQVEKKLLDLYAEGLIGGTVHTCVGQELSAVFAGKYFKKYDQAFSNHRGHGHFLSITKNKTGLLAELLSKKSGCSSGYGGSQHLYAHNFISNGIQGGLMPMAAGWAFNAQKQKKTSVALIFIGDGTLGQGLFYEALNLIGLWNLPVIIVIENNFIAQSNPSINSISGKIIDRINAFNINFIETDVWDIVKLDNAYKDAFEYVREKKKPVVLQVNCSRLNAHSKGDDNRSINFLDDLNKKDILNSLIDEELISKKVQTSINDEINRIVSDIKNEKILLKVEKFKPISSSPLTLLEYADENPEITNLKKINNGLDFALQDSNTIMVGEDIEDTPVGTDGIYGGAFKVTKGLSSKYTGRVKNTPISEATICGFSIGYAFSGKLAIAEIMFGDFMLLCLDQIVQHASKLKFMYGREIDLPLIIRTPMGGRRGYGPTHSQSIEKVFLGWPGINVVAVNCFSNIKNIIKFIADKKNRTPHILIENKLLYSMKSLPIPYGYKHYVTDELIPNHIIKPGKDKESKVLIFCYGYSLNQALDIANNLFLEYEIFVEIVCPENISPLNLYPIEVAINNKDAAIFIEEGPIFGSVSSQIISCLGQQKLLPNHVKIYGNDSVIPASKEAESELLVTTQKIIDDLSDMRII